MSLVALAAATLAVAAPAPKPVGRTERRQAAGLLIGRRRLIEESRDTSVPIVTRREVTVAFREQRRAYFPRHGGEQQVVLDTYIAGFRRKWLARTVCLARWVDGSSCGRIVRRR